MTVEILTKIVEDTMKNSTVSNIRLSTACLLAYAEFLRADELIKLWPCDITVDPDKMIVGITGSKTDQLCHGDEVPIT